MREVPLVYPLNTSDVTRWTEMVSTPAKETVKSFLDGDPIKLQPLEKIKRLADGCDEEKQFFCSICERVFIGEFQWQLHQKSNKHKRTLASKKKKEKLQSEKTAS